MAYPTGAGAETDAGIGAISDRIDSASSLAAPLSTGLFEVPSHTTNQRCEGPTSGVLAAGEPTTLVHIWPIGLLGSLNLTS